MTQEIKVINETDESQFEAMVNDYLEEGYEVSSTNCGFLNSEHHDFITSFQAVLVKK